MKKILIATLTAIMLGSTVVGCGSSNEGTKVEASKVATADIVEKIKGAVEVRTMGAIDATQAKEMFQINLDNAEEFTLENGMINTGLETIFVIKAKDGKVDSVKEDLEKVKENKKSAAFYPGEAEAVEGAKVEVVGNYVGLFIIPDYEDGQKNSEKAVEAFKEALK